MRKKKGASWALLSRISFKSILVRLGDLRDLWISTSPGDVRIYIGRINYPCWEPQDRQGAIEMLRPDWWCRQEEKSINIRATTLWATYNVHQKLISSSRTSKPVLVGWVQNEWWWKQRQKIIDSRLYNRIRRLQVRVKFPGCIQLAIF